MYSGVIGNMGHGVKIRSPRIANVKVYSPKAIHIAAVAKTSIKTSPKTRFSYRYGLPRKQKIISGNFGAHPTKSLNLQAKLFGEPKDLNPSKKSLPSHLSNLAVITPGFGAPMMIGMGLMSWLNFRGDKKTPKQLTASSEESSSQALLVRKKDSKELAVIKTEIKAIDGSGKNIFRVPSGKDKARAIFKSLKDISLGEIAVVGAINAIVFWATSFILQTFLIAGTVTLFFIGLEKAKDKYGLMEGLRIKKNVKKINKLRGDKIPVLDSSEISIYQALSNDPKYSLELLAARALKDAPALKVESWMNEMFGDNLPAKLQWIRRGKVRGGSQLLIDLLKVGKLTKPEILWIFETIREIGGGKRALSFIYELYSAYPSFGRHKIKKHDKESIEELISILEHAKRGKAEGKEFGESPGGYSELKKDWQRRGFPASEKKVELFFKLIKRWVNDLGIKRFEIGIILEKRINLTEISDPEGYKWPRSYLFRVFRNFKHLTPAEREEFLKFFGETFKPAWRPSDPAYLEIADKLVSSGYQKFVRDNIHDWLQSIQQSGFDPSLINQAKIVGKAGHREEALIYLDKVEELPDLNSQQKLDLAKAYSELGFGEESLTIAEKLLADPEVDFEAAELMDKLKPGWDDFIPRIETKQLGPYR